MLSRRELVKRGLLAGVGLLATVIPTAAQEDEPEPEVIEHPDGVWEVPGSLVVHGSLRVGTWRRT